MMEYTWTGEIAVAGLVLREVQIEGYIKMEDGRWEHGDWYSVKVSQEEVDGELRELLYKQFTETVAPRELLVEESWLWVINQKGWWKWVGALVVAVLTLWGAVNAEAAGDWTKEDVALEAVYATLHVADWAQTRYIAAHPERYWERNPILGRHPSDSEVNLYFGATLLAHAAVTHLLPTEASAFGATWNPRRVWQGVTIGAQAAVVGWNISLGIGMKF